MPRTPSRHTEPGVFRLRVKLRRTAVALAKAVRPGVVPAAFALMLLVTCHDAAAQTTAAAPPPARPVWDLSASFYGYFIPDESDYLQPTVTADRGWLHLEARANYEGKGAGSAWVGWNLSAGTRVVFDVTPMVGAVFGDIQGVAPGCRSALSWRGLELSSESEYVFDAAGRADWFFYNWSEFTLAPVEWFRFGLVAQRTRAYASAREIQRGFVVGFSLSHLDIAAHVFNPDDAAPTYVLNATVSFSLGAACQKTR